MRFTYPHRATLQLPDERTVPLVSVRYASRCAFAGGCSNLVRSSGPARCAAHATVLDVAFQIAAPVFQADQFIGCFLGRPWGRA